MRQSKSQLLHKQFIERWSPRAMLSDPIPMEDLMPMFEAAHWAPSCFNEQPWRFVLARQEEDKKRFLSILAQGNQVWAHRAPVLVAVFAKNYFDHDGSDNAWCEFDSGSAFMALSLQAMHQGYACHGMGGFDKDKAYEVCGVDKENYRAIAMIAIGKRANKEILPEELQAIESPNVRHPIERTVYEGIFDDIFDKEKRK
jgi:nitroreductase